MRSIKVTQQKFAHQSLITSIIQNFTGQNKDSQIISIGLDGFLKIWNINNLQLVRKIRLPYWYLMCLERFQQGVLIGVGQGIILKLDDKFQVVFKKKIHQDCISSIIIKKDYLITSSYDGKLKFVSLQTYQVIQEVDVQLPIFQAIQFQNHIYLAGTTAFKYSLKSKELTKLPRYDCFKIFAGKLYACSDDKGLTCISKKTNSYIPCHFLIQYKNHMLAFSDQCIGIVNHQEHIQWKCMKVKEIQNGYSIEAGVLTPTGVIVGGDSELLYKIEFVNFNWDAQSIE